MLSSVLKPIVEGNAVVDPGNGIDVHDFHRNARTHTNGARRHRERGCHGDEEAANREALSGALAGGIGNRGVSAAAGGDHFHIAAASS